MEPIEQNRKKLIEKIYTCTFMHIIMKGFTTRSSKVKV